MEVPCLKRPREASKFNDDNPLEDDFSIACRDRAIVNSTLSEQTSARSLPRNRLLSFKVHLVGYCTAGSSQMGNVLIKCYSRKSKIWVGLRRLLRDRKIIQKCIKKYSKEHKQRICEFREDIRALKINNKPLQSDFPPWFNV